MKSSVELNDIADKFLRDNQEMLVILGDKIARERKKDVVTLHELKGKNTAIRIINEWLQDIWGLKSVDDLPISQEDNIFKIIQNNEKDNETF